jgi:general secretion pathway protein M
MTVADYSLQRYLARYPYAAVTVYLLLAAAFIVAIWVSLADILEARAELSSSLDILGQLEARRPPSGAASAGSSPAAAIPAGSPFLGGGTITVAGAVLLQRVAGTIARFGGTVQSSQVDLQGQQAKDGFVTLLISCELEQPSLQPLLYDLEAGMPFLFIDQLVVQGPQGSTAENGSRMRLLISVSGEWQGPK